ncbi:hypothetical protein HPB52_015628 [Rhipicephalus sanguineus]|uniref:Uncharacterized protein n=1 Tax=Rhipicephalus sanguineus TaxID=34632 RepID=A0A9D4Q739_RHISA|nr:hypothetical protein HPB52_015628 [Rhipicephalus sanguineus]
MDINQDIPATGGALVFPANQWAELEGATGWLTGAVVDYHSPCSVTPHRPCHIVGKLAALNELLFPSRVQLQEIPGTRGLLALGSINDSVPSMDEPPDLRLRQSTSLMHLLLKHHKCISTLYVGPLHFQQYLSLICDALPYSRLKKLRLVCSDRLMSENGCAALSSMTSLEELDCSFISLLPSSFSRYISAEFPTALAALVRASHSLGVLRIEGVIMEEHATKNLLLYLTESGVLKDVTLGRRVVPETCREELAHYLMFAPSLTSFSFEADSESTEFAKESGVHDKVSCGTYYVNDHRDLLKCTMFSGLSLQPHVPPHVKAAALRQLPDHDHFTYLHLNVPRGNLAVSSALAEYIQSTSVLRKLELSTVMKYAPELEPPDEWWRVIVQSLSRNNSIKELVLYVHKMSDSGVESLADTVKESTNIGKLAFLDSGTTSVSAFVNRLSVDIMDNHTLLGVLLQGQMDEGWLDASKKVFTIYEATRRNSDSTLLAAATAFTKTTELDRYASQLGLENAELRDWVERECAHARDERAKEREVAKENAEWQQKLLEQQQKVQEQELKILELKLRLQESAGRQSAEAGAAPQPWSASTSFTPSCWKTLRSLWRSTWAEIGGMVDRHLKRTASLDKYMRITGVVKEQVVCHPRHDGCTQLDDLHEDCWEMVRRYLMLDDVEEVVTHLENR